MKIDYRNAENGASRLKTALHYLYNVVRTWVYFHLRYRNVEYKGFIRVLIVWQFPNIIGT